MSEVFNQEGVSLIIPTLREANNIPTLIHRIAQIDFRNRPFEMIVVDDNSQDGIFKMIQDFSVHYPWISLIVRQKKRSLSDAVIEGFYKARYPILVTMDADLSHPPEKIPDMLRVLEESHVDMVIGSRYVDGGSTGDAWPLYRRWISVLAAFPAKILLQHKVHDPLSGFLAIKKSTFLESDPFHPIGWKIGLELMIKCHCRHILEIPIHFSKRFEGVSKLTLKVVFEYLIHLKRLYFYKLCYKKGRD